MFMNSSPCHYTYLCSTIYMFIFIIYIYIYILYIIYCIYMIYIYIIYIYIYYMYIYIYYIYIYSSFQFRWWKIVVSDKSFRLCEWCSASFAKVATALDSVTEKSTLINLWKLQGTPLLTLVFISFFVIFSRSYLCSVHLIFCIIALCLIDY